VRRPHLLLVVSVTALCVPVVGAAASDASLRTTLNTWSKKVGVDAHSVSLAAQRRHPRRMTYSANRFHRDAVRARTAIVAQKPTSAKGRQARRLALTAFADYARAGSEWAASGRSRLNHQRAASIKSARAGARDAAAGNRLLITAGKLLRS
jgi:hypothetical protein